MYNTSHVLAWLLLFSLLEAAGCEQGRAKYDVTVRNNTPEKFYNVRIVFSNKKFDFEYGVLVSKGNKGFSAAYEPLPDSATVSWRTTVHDIGPLHSVTVDVANIAPTRQFQGEVFFTIQPDGSVKVHFGPRASMPSWDR